jgi:transposase InsO family protein
MEWARVPTLKAIDRAAAEHGVSRSSIYLWQSQVKGAPEADWRYWLAHRHIGAQDSATIPAPAWDALCGDYLRLEAPAFAECARRLRLMAREHGWGALPSDRTIYRRLQSLPPELLVLARQGEQALRRLFPAQTRDRSHFHALEAVNADGHKVDVFVRWEDGTIARPVLVAFQDLYSGKLLSWRVDRTENKVAVRLAFGDMVARYGIPSFCWFDNGRNFASKWLTGGTQNRYRFKIRDEDPTGILPALGVEVRWTRPYSGQSKPIERAFRDLAGGLAKHPAFAGAYTGNKPDAKPENYASAAVPIATFLEVTATAIAEHNARLGRRSAVCQGRSFDVAFNDSYAAAPVRKATEEQRKLWLLAAESARVRDKTADIHFAENRYWHEDLLRLRGQQVVVRFDPDDLHADLQVYGLDGAFLCAARCVEAVGFDSLDAARAHAQARNAWLRATRVQLAAEKKLSALDIAALLPRAEDAEPPETKVVRPLFRTAGNAALKVVPEAVESPLIDAREARERRVIAALKLHHATGRDQPVADED